MRSSLVPWLALALGAGAARAGPDPAGFVDPFVGTGGHGHTYPGPALPFGMIQPGPDTRLTGWDGCSGYHHDDSTVVGFSHTHLSGTGVSDYGDILFLPATGPVRIRSGYENPGGEGYGSRFRKETEKAEAGYYRVRLDESGVDVELTATTRTGWHRYTFPESESAHLLVDLTHRDPVIESHLRIVDDTTIEGMRRSRAWAADQPVHFVAKLSRPFEAVLYVDDEPRPTLREARGTNTKAVLRFRTRAGEPIVVKLAISAVDLEGARRNLETEGKAWDFDAVRGAARSAWSRALSRIEVEGSDEARKRIFYTALYRAMLQPNVFQDVDGRHLGMDRRIHVARGYTRHTVFSLWDTFRAAHPLYTILEQKRTADFIRTFLEQYREGGRLPVWELWGNETDCMIGYHSVSVIVDAWVKGIRGFDADLALAAMKASANADRSGLPAYRAHGYVPADREGESVSKTLEYAYDDWCIARFARDIGREEDAREFLRRAQGWQHLAAPDGFLRPRANGMWVSPFDPAEVTFHYTEANAWQYRFFVPQDVSGLMRRLGGPPALERSLDELFGAESRLPGRDQPDISGLVGQYAHGNEPSHHMAYLYAFAGAPHKTQAMARRLMDEMYSARPDGLAGNEDCGQMSAWYVLSALGLYPVTPGTGDYVIGTPLFDRATIHLGNGKSFVIRAVRPDDRAFYVQSLALNGRAYSRAFLPHDVLMKGGELVFNLGPRPSSWGSAAEDRPRTAIGDVPVVPAPVAEGTTPFREPTPVVLRAPDSADVLHYALDGRDVDSSARIYASPLRWTDTGTIRFRARRGTEWSPLVETTLRRIDPIRKLVLESPFSSQYPAGGGDALIDGIRGGTDFRLGTWQGFHGMDLDAVLDLGEVREIHRVATGFLHDPNSWIFFPLEVTYAVSEDGKTWSGTSTVKSDLDLPHEKTVIRDFASETHGTRARYVRVRAKASILCPDWHKGAGEKSWIFADEIAVE